MFLLKEDDQFQLFLQLDWLTLRLQMWTDCPLVAIVTFIATSMLLNKWESNRTFSA